MSENKDPKKDSFVKPNKKENHQKEELSLFELLELMGVFRDQYHRKNRRVKKR